VGPSLEIVFEAVRQHGEALRYAAEELRKDREVVIEALRQNGDALRHAAEELRRDREVVLEAVRQNGEALFYAAEELQSDPELQPSIVFSNAIAGRGAHARVFTIRELSQAEDSHHQNRQLVLSALGLGSGRIVYMPRDATLGDLACTLVDRHEDSNLVFMVMPGDLIPGPLDAPKPLAEFFL